MEAKRSRNALLWTAVAALLSQNLIFPVMSRDNLDDQKNYYSPDPHAHSPPAVSYNPPPYSSGGGHASPTPSHGAPAHGGGSHGGTPPANCGNPPSGGHHHTTPSPPAGGGGGGYYHSPPTSSPTPTTPTPTPITPTTPTIVSPPTTIAPPTTPIDPGTSTPPGITIPSPPFAFDPNSPPFTCNYWRNHPTLIWALFGWWGTVGNAFSIPSAPGLGANMNLLQALLNTRTDGLGELYREGTAALLNTMAHTRYPYTTNQVRDSFVTALSSDRAALAQAQLFKLANEGRIKPRALTCLVYIQHLPDRMNKPTTITPCEARP